MRVHRLDRHRSDRARSAGQRRRRSTDRPLWPDGSKEHFKRSEYTGADDLVFCHPESGAPFDASKMRKRFKDGIKAAGVRTIRFHDLRHTFGTRMAAAGAPLRTIQELRRGTLAGILRDADLSSEDLRRLLD